MREIVTRHIACVGHLQLVNVILHSSQTNLLQLIGSSLLILYDADENVGIWMIDFTKTLPVPANFRKLSHRQPWQPGNHEDGYLFGLDHLIEARPLHQIGIHKQNLRFAILQFKSNSVIVLNTGNLMILNYDLEINLDLRLGSACIFRSSRTSARSSRFRLLPTGTSAPSSSNDLQSTV